MITFTHGDIFETKPRNLGDSYALVNTVNCEGVMGKGIALEFKSRYPEMFKSYRECCSRNLLRPGKLHTWICDGLHLINFPTKVRWREPSQMSWIEAGLARLFAHVIPSNQISSIGIPALGCNNGGLRWDDVKKVIQKWYYVFDDILEQVDVIVYEPLGIR